LKLMTAVTAPASSTTRQDTDDPLSWIAQDSSKPGRPKGVATQWVAQTGEAFSVAHLEKTPEEMPP
jgi:predicted NAD/FAD-dependent oxidoreductase